MLLMLKERGPRWGLLPEAARRALPMLKEVVKQAGTQQLLHAAGVVQPHHPCDASSLVEQQKHQLDKQQQDAWG